MLNRQGNCWEKQVSPRQRGRRNGVGSGGNLRLTSWKGASFSVRDLSADNGEIIGLLGLTGAGHFDFAQSLFEPRLATGGTYELDGVSCADNQPSEMKGAGVAFVPDQRMKNALIGDWSVQDSLSVIDLEKAAIRHAGVVNLATERQWSKRVIERLSIKVSSLDQKISTLSGGNKQKVSIGRWLFWNERKIKLFVFIEPTEGVDIGGKAEIHEVMLALAARGAIIIVASSDLAELAEVSDRVIPFVAGSSRMPIDRSDFNESNFISAIAGKEVI
jgi:ribose transport system ATP-binding protein